MTEKTETKTTEPLNHCAINYINYFYYVNTFSLNC